MKFLFGRIIFGDLRNPLKKYFFKIFLPKETFMMHFSGNIVAGICHMVTIL